MDSSTFSSYSTFRRFGDFGGMPIVLIALIMACPSVKGTQNVALGKSVYQTGTRYGGVPDRAVDGNTDGLFRHDSCSHTGTDGDAWWKVDLGDVYVIDHVTIYNRHDCCGGWMRDVVLFIGLDDSDYILHGNHSGEMATSYTFQMPPYVYGRWVKISRISVQKSLVLCEVMVMGSEIETAKVLQLKQVEDVIGTGVVLDASQANSMISCCMQCKKTSKCAAVNYLSTTGTCDKLETVSTTSDFDANNYFYRLN